MHLRHRRRSAPRAAASASGPSAPAQWSTGDRAVADEPALASAAAQRGEIAIAQRQDHDVGVDAARGQPAPRRRAGSRARPRRASARGEAATHLAGAEDVYALDVHPLCLARCLRTP